jgi:hypothetical protein
MVFLRKEENRVEIDGFRHNIYDMTEIFEILTVKSLKLIYLFLVNSVIAKPTQLFQSNFVRKKRYSEFVLIVKKI